MNKYELMYLLNEKSDSKKIQTEIEKLIKDYNGKIIEFQEMGLKDLAYEINKEKKANYFLFNFETDNTSLNKEINRVLKIKEEVLRFMIIKED